MITLTDHISARLDLERSGALGIVEGNGASLVQTGFTQHFLDVVGLPLHRLGVGKLFVRVHRFFLLALVHCLEIDLLRGFVGQGVSTVIPKVQLARVLLLLIGLIVSLVLLIIKVSYKIL